MIGILADTGWCFVVFMIIQIGKAANMRRVSEDLPKFLDFLGSYSITSGEIIGIFPSLGMGEDACDIPRVFRIGYSGGVVDESVLDLVVGDQCSVRTGEKRHAVDGREGVVKIVTLHLRVIREEVVLEHLSVKTADAVVRSDPDESLPVLRDVVEVVIAQPILSTVMGEDEILAMRRKCPA